jgi:hypothetical protein
MWHSQDTVWQDRWQSLVETMTYLSGRYAALSNPTARALLACLQAFGDSQFHFFSNGFKEGSLLPSLVYPVEYTLRATLDQVALDLSVIQQVVEQREQGSAVMQATLEKADALAQQALDLAVAGGLLSQKRVVALTYFQKAPAIRVIPYAPVALIGIPFTAIHHARDLLAIPHEAGHYIYRHTPGLATYFDAAVPLQPAWRRRWIEEIFADVYSCLVAGPVIGLDFQDLLLDDWLDDFMGDDGEHPVNVIRPIIYNHTLAALGFPLAAAALAERWAAWLVRRGNPTSFLPYGQDGAVSLVEARASVAETADQIVAYLDGARQERQARPDYWSQEMAADAPVETLYDSFNQWLQTVSLATPPQLQEIGRNVAVVSGDKKTTNKRQKGETLSWIDDIKRQGSKGRYPLSATAWLPVLSSGSWNIKGPESGWPP